MSTSTPSSSLLTCRHCGEPDPAHQDDHPTLCCACFDVSVGMPVDAINRERAAKGRPPIAPWPRRVVPDEDA